jgi:antitoxin (DNA-binding transcriptional repressor) of toxin-antitoxin stability system
MKRSPRLGVEAARKAFPSLIDDAHEGRSTVITKHGKPWAMIGPPAEPRAEAVVDIRQLRGTGKGLWGRSPARTVDKMRGEWDQD